MKRGRAQESIQYNIDKSISIKNLKTAFRKFTADYKLSKDNYLIYVTKT